MARALTSHADRQDATVDNFIAGPLGRGNDGIGRRSEDDPNLVTHKDYTFDWQAGGGGSDESFRGKSRAWIDDKPGRTRALVKNKTLAVHTSASVRRLTPTECERLQALPDGWTQIGGSPDSRRYAGLGDAVTASVSEWIGGRIIEADAAMNHLRTTPAGVPQNAVPDRFEGNNQ